MQFSRSWIGTTLSAAAAALAVGCAGPEPLVWVDLEHAARQVALPAAAEPRVTGFVESTPAAAITFPEYTPRPRQDQARQRRLEALRLMEEELVRTHRELRSAYLARQLRLADAEAGQLRAEFVQRLADRQEVIREDISSLIQAPEGVVTERGEITSRLALLSGWPRALLEQNPARIQAWSFVPIARVSEVKALWDAEAQELRASLVELDAMIEARIDAVRAAARAITLADRAALARDIDALRERAADQARRQAEARVLETGRHIIPGLLIAEIPLPAVPPQTVTIPAAVVSVSAPLDYPEPILPIEAMRTRLNIWAAVHGYKLARGPRLAADKTGEFIAWIDHR